MPTISCTCQITTPECLSQLQVIMDWCSQWGMAINAEKSQVIHVRNHQKPRCQHKLFCSGQDLMYIHTYKYLGYYVHEHSKDIKTIEVLPNSAKRAFGSVINIFKKLGNMGYKTYDTLANSNILQIANYGEGVWALKNIVTLEYCITK